MEIDPVTVKMAVKAGIQAATDEQSRKRLLIFILTIIDLISNSIYTSMWRVIHVSSATILDCIFEKNKHKIRLFSKVRKNVIMSIVMSINSGSSSLKFQLFTMPEEDMIASGMVERIGLPKSIFSVKTHSHEQTETLTIADHKEAIQLVLKALIDFKVVASLAEIEGIGHRIVHGGEKYSASVIVDDQVENDIENNQEIKKNVEDIISMLNN